MFILVFQSSSFFNCKVQTQALHAPSYLPMKDFILNSNKNPNAYQIMTDNFTNVK